MKKILIVEDQTILRESLEYLISGQNDLEVVGITNDNDEIMMLCRELKPDLVLMDAVTKKTANGISNAKKIRTELPEIKVVMMTGTPEITFVEEARKAGAHSFMNKNVGKDHLLHIIRNTLNGYSIYSDPTEHPPPFAAAFNQKEIAVIRMVCQGMNRDEIAQNMGLSVSMIKRHIGAILNKSGFDSISKFALYAVGEGFIMPGTSK